MTEEDLEVANERGDREDWLDEGGCPILRLVKKQNVSNFRRNGVSLAISAKGQHQIKTKLLPLLTYRGVQK